ncbi:hypothetical protein Goshw_022084 [Gossypium schwendimanii]|uniref:Uncharacterized protein n=1 Tax=Gossypium schwendimanii TaxID=34291 RepID=A0A7J9KYZ0_GOSSC|nr:hypothetical protein [Gossypium schwendimanii]
MGLISLFICTSLSEPPIYILTHNEVKYILDFTIFHS